MTVWSSRPSPYDQQIPMLTVLPTDEMRHCSLAFCVRGMIVPILGPILLLSPFCCLWCTVKLKWKREDGRNWMKVQSQQKLCSRKGLRINDSSLTKAIPARKVFTQQMSRPLVFWSHATKPGSQKMLDEAAKAWHLVFSESLTVNPQRSLQE